jgi:hypothetical protein
MPRASTLVPRTHVPHARTRLLLCTFLSTHCTGAVAFGVKPDLVRARRARMTYGVKCSAPYVDGAPGKFWSEVCGPVHLHMSRHGS